MSRAFVREDDELPEDPVGPLPAATLPPGVRNLLTPGGARRLRDEIERLAVDERPRLLAGQEDPDTKRELNRLDQRLRQLRQSLAAADVITPPPPPHTQVLFGATVSVRDAHGGQSSYRIVGVDEIDPDRGWISWQSPLARALHQARLGSRVSFRSPAGQQNLEITGISYDAA